MLNLPLIHTYQSLPKSFYQGTQAEKVSNPNLLLFNQSLAESLGLPLAAKDNETLSQIFSGQSLPETASPIAQAYAGHQFGNLAMLGDGRALLLGELRTSDNTLVDIQLKGSGRTPYSRNGDGKAALAPMLREYLVSEAMFALGIPTSRSLAVVTTGDTVRRLGEKQGAILTRTAASHIRIGTFVYAAMLANQSNDSTPLISLLDYSIERHYPELLELAASDNTKNIALAFITAVGRQQISLINNWLRVGFIHGVMNTDNICISGETIDYGPCAFMNTYSEDTVFSSIDHHGRYAYGNQSAIILWNIARLAESLLPLIHSNEETSIELASNAIEDLSTQQKYDWENMMANKLGLSINPKKQSTGTQKLTQSLLTIMQQQKLDYTNMFVTLTQLINNHINNPHNTSIAASALNEWIKSEDYLQTDYADTNISHQDFSKWSTQWIAELNDVNTCKTDWQLTLDAMEDNNPTVIPRNHLVESALSAAEVGDIEPFKTLLNILSMPYENPTMSGYQQPSSESESASYQTFCGT